jgi:hypothetical protein
MGAPPMIAGSASTESAGAVVICGPVDAVSAAAASPPSTPAFCSITTERRRRARDDPAKRIAGQLRARDRKRSLRGQRDPLELPQTERARHLEEEHEDREGPVQMLERTPRGEDRDQAGNGSG